MWPRKPGSTLTAVLVGCLLILGAVKPVLEPGKGRGREPWRRMQMFGSGPVATDQNASTEHPAAPVERRKSLAVGDTACSKLSSVGWTFAKGTCEQLTSKNSGPVGPFVETLSGPEHTHLWEALCRTCLVWAELEQAVVPGKKERVSGGIFLYPGACSACLCYRLFGDFYLMP